LNIVNAAHNTLCSVYNKYRKLNKGW
jgi:hypothetical protein